MMFVSIVSNSTLSGHRWSVVSKYSNTKGSTFHSPFCEVPDLIGSTLEILPSNSMSLY